MWIEYSQIWLSLLWASVRNPLNQKNKKKQDLSFLDLSAECFFPNNVVDFSDPQLVNTTRAPRLPVENH